MTETITDTVDSPADSPAVPGRTAFFRRRSVRRPAIGAATAVLLIGTVGGGAWAADSRSAGVASSVHDGLVDIVSTEKYQGAVSAGTGMILSSTGEILTNNHVIEGATSIKVTIVATGDTYTATVVGTDATDDVAVIRLKGASGLKTMPLGDSDDVSVGDDVMASGNANGDGGEPNKVSGSVTALGQSITASDESGSGSEQLTGLIQTDAPIVAGDSGGALADSDGDVIGMNTAASTSSGSTTPFQNTASTSTASEAYAIPINDALQIAEKIENGDASDTITIGTQGFLGIQLASAGTSVGGGFGRRSFADPYGYGYGSTGSGSGATSGVTGVTVSGVVDGEAADDAGITAGSTITAVNGTTVGTADELNTVMAKTSSGQKVTVTWVDSSGSQQSATVTLTAAPAA